MKLYKNMSVDELHALRDKVEARMAEALKTKGVAGRNKFHDQHANIQAALAARGVHDVPWNRSNG